MPWEKSFDTEEVLDRATDVFWAKGYEATSVSDLLTATGINKGSLYNAFGSKKALFMKALEKYAREQHRKTLAELAATHDPVGAIEALFDALIAQSSQDCDKKGCLLINTALNLPNHDGEVADFITAGLAEVETFFAQQIEAGQKTGAIPSDLDVTEAAKGLLTLVAGLRVLARGVFQPESLVIIKKQAIDIIS